MPIALFRYGNSSESTMWPGRSPTTTVARPRPSTKPVTSSTTAGSASTVRVTSTSVAPGTAEYQRRPRTRPARRVVAASSVTDSVEVLLARTASASRISSSWLKISSFRASFSGTASITSSQSARSDSSRRSVMWPRASVCCSSVSAPAPTAPCSDCSRVRCARSTPASSCSMPITSSPERASTSTIPAPRTPTPTTPTLLNCRATKSLLLDQPFARVSQTGREAVRPGLNRIHPRPARAAAWRDTARMSDPSSAPDLNAVTHFAINSDDVEAARDFYAAVFSWRFESWGPPGFFHIRRADGSTPGPIGALQQRRELLPGTPQHGFECTVAVSDVRATLAVVQDAGGRVLMEPSVIPSVGELAFFADLDGNVCGVMRYERDAGAGT